MVGLFESAGAQPRNPSRGKPIHVARMETGLFTNRNALHDPAQYVISKFYGGYIDALIDGSNMEVSNQLSLIRRPGLSRWSSVAIPDQVNWFYNWRTLTQGLKVIVDTATATYLQTPTTQLQLFTKSAGAGQGYYQGVADTLYYGDGIDLQKVQVNGNNKIGPYNWGIAAPTSAPTVTEKTVTAGTTWVANTVWSTMGIIFDATSGTLQQLISVNASGTNTTQFGTSGTGEPAWNLTPGNTTSDGTVTWTNFGPVRLWKANQLYNNFSVGGTLTNPCMIYDPTTNTLQGNTNAGNAQGTSGTSKPAFNATAGGNTYDPIGDAPPGVKWFAIPPNVPRTIEGVGKWAKNTAYTKWGVSGSTAFSAVLVPYTLPPPNGDGSLGKSDIFLMVCRTAGTSSNTPVQPHFSSVAGTPTLDGDLIWMSLGSATYQSSHAYTAWTVQGAVFSAIKDSNNNIQVCTTSGTTDVAANAPGTTISGTITVANAVGGNTVYTLPSSQSFTTGRPVVISGFTNAANNGTFNVVSSSGTSLTVNNSAGVAETSAATVVYNPFGTAYGQSTQDGSVVWVCVGNSMTWAASTKWYLPSAGFVPPVGSVTYGGASVIDSNNNIQSVIASGLGGASAPSWSTGIGNTTTDNAATWINVGAASPNFFTWTKGYQYAYSFSARTSNDQFNTTTPPGWGLLPNTGGPLGPPTGSKSGGVSTASPLATITGPNGGTGAANFLQGVGSTDPQVDTIIIWRTLDGGSTLFFLTEIPNPAPNGNNPGNWSFTDFLSDSVVNELIPAPINHQNDPPPAGFLPMAYHFERIWGAVGNFVFCSGGPDVQTGNPNESFDPANFFEFPSPVTRIVPTATGILIFLTSDIYAIQGGPVFDTFFPTPMIPGVGLLHFNALDVYGGVIFMYTADNQLMSIDPSSGVNRIGGPIADKLQLFDASKVYVTVHQSGNDNAVFVSDGQTGWYRLNPNQFPNGNAVWSPFAMITNGAGAVQSIEVSPGIHRLLVGGIGNNTHILQRDFSTYQDDGTNYTCFFTMGSINLVHPGQIAGLTFINVRATRVGSSPTVSFLLNEINGTFTTFPESQPYPWQIYGSTLQPTSLYSNAYYFRPTGVPALAEHLQVKVSFPAENFANEVLTLTIFGVIEQPPEE